VNRSKKRKRKEGARREVISFMFTIVIGLDRFRSSSHIRVPPPAIGSITSDRCRRAVGTTETRDGCHRRKKEPR
jgi:hypothetical protein